MVMSFFRRPDESGIEHIEAQVQRMVNDARHTFDLALNAITGGSVETVADEVRRTDRRINVTEMEIRRELVVHFAVHGGADATEMLVFMNMIKDLERIGDYNKNIFDLAEEGVSFAGADGGHHGADLFVAQDTVRLVKHAFHVEDLTLQGQDRLEAPVSALLCGSPG